MYGLGQRTDLGSYSDTSLSQVKRAIETYLEENPRSSVRFKSFVAHNDPIDELRTVGNRFNNGRIEVTSHEDHYQVDLSRTIKRSDRTVTGSFAIFNHEATEVWTCLTGHGSDFFERGLNWAINNCSPSISEFYATSRDLETVLDRFSEVISFDSTLLVTQAVAYSHREEAEISYETRPYPEVFTRAREGGNYIDSLSFQLRGQPEENFKAKITRDGVTQLRNGQAELFFNYLLEDYVSFAQTKAEILDDTERSRATGDVQQIEINFESPVFQSPKDNKDLIQALTDLSRSSVTVYHKNPYAHVSLLDFNDGSSCDVFVTDPDSITIVPSYRGSVNFLMRISDKIYRELDESSIELVDSSTYSVEDFIEG